MFILLCGLMLLIALAVNLTDRRMLALTCVVGVSFFLPTPDSYDQFYISCISAECLTAIFALRLKAAGSILVAELCALLVITHLLGYSLDGSPPFSPYRVIVKLLEFSQIAACAALSPVIAPILRNHDAKKT